MPGARCQAALLITLLALAVGCGETEREQGTASARNAPAAGEQGRALARGAPPELAELYSQGGELLEGGADAFRSRLAQLRGYPVVVNKWASWCGPCRSELPYFRSQARKRGRRIAFIGSNTNDSVGPARRFLAEVPIPFPSYADPNGDVAQVFRGAIAFPTTAFYGRDGRLATVKQGVYTSERELAADIERYAR